MLEFREKRKIRNILYSKITLVLLMGLIIVVGSATLNVYDKQKESNKAKLKIQEEYNRLEKREIELQTSIERLQTEKGVEEEIRKRFGVVSEGEEVIIVVDPKTKTDTDKKVGSSSGFWGKLFGF